MGGGHKTVKGGSAEKDRLSAMHAHTLPMGKF
nr:MAG TPA: hypothetical protein [Caudoviricetes sp.]DAR15751.1 MAG TPA: hypothetical protein [Caudoviricetes sp.]